MARPEDLYESDAVCVKKLFRDNNIEKKCQCPRCTGRGNRKVPKSEIMFPELLENAAGKEKK